MTSTGRNMQYVQTHGVFIPGLCWMNSNKLLSLLCLHQSLTGNRSQRCPLLLMLLPAFYHLSTLCNGSWFWAMTNFPQWPSLYSLSKDHTENTALPSHVPLVWWHRRVFTSCYIAMTFSSGTHYSKLQPSCYNILIWSEENSHPTQGHYIV
jgi:hypothetical protein